MTAKLKLTAYAVLIVLAAWLGWGFYTNYSRATSEASETSTNNPPTAATNASMEATNTNAVAVSTNVPSTNTASTNVAAAAHPAATAPHSAKGSVFGYLGGFVLAIIGLGMLIAYDFTHYVTNTAVDALLDDRGEGLRDPEYERAEQTWANGKHLEAIQMMRDFLKAHPREQYAALRIAEIYEKDLNNPLAAAMEYEDVLKQRLPAERWGWAAIHLCNLYSKLGQQDKTMALLQRIADDYPKTAAAKKARARLGLPEPETPAFVKDTTRPAGEGLESAAPKTQPEEPAEPEPPPEPEAPKSNLPPGFRPRK